MFREQLRINLEKEFRLWQEVISRNMTSNSLDSEFPSVNSFEHHVLPGLHFFGPSVHPFVSTLTIMYGKEMR